jgi:hypothetical protein
MANLEQFFSDLCQKNCASIFLDPNIFMDVWASTKQKYF